MSAYALTDTGLYVPPASTDSRKVARELLRHDPDLRLVASVHDGGQLWRVYRHIGSGVDPEFVCAWMNETTGEPYPLTMGLVDRVKQLDLNSRAERVTVDEHNRQLVDRVRQDARRQHTDNAAEHAPYLDRGRLSVGLTTGSRKPYWLRNQHLPRRH